MEMRGERRLPSQLFPRGGRQTVPRKEPSHALLSHCMPLSDLRTAVAGEGCSHSVKISQRSLPDALRVLQRTNLEPKRIYITAGDGSYQEVEL